MARCYQRDRAPPDRARGRRSGHGRTASIGSRERRRSGRQRLQAADDLLGVPHVQLIVEERIEIERKLAQALVGCEQITGLSRVLRADAQAALEDVALWHERDISHSSVERVILPDATTLLDYLQHATIALVEGMTVDGERMRQNLELTHGALFSQRVLLALVEHGTSREDAYRIVQ